MTQTVCFFARVKDPSVLKRVEFYAQDLRILRELGFDVRITTRISELRPADFYYVWWWSWAFAPVTLACILRRPVIVTGVLNHQRTDGVWEFELRPYWQRVLIRYAARKASANVFLSKIEFEFAKALFGAQTKNYYSPCPIDTELYSPAPDTARNDLLLTVAWMNPPNARRKCIPQIIEAAAIIHRARPHTRFVLAGDPTTFEPELKRMISAVGGEGFIECPGPITREQKIDYMRRAAIYLQPTFTEGFGLAIAEAMACGTAVVTSRVGTVPEVAGDAVAYVDQSPVQIAREAIRLLDDVKTRQKLGECARRRIVEHFSYARRKQDIQTLISKLQLR